ncbi:MAG: DEAD/DEAH box helicase [Bryobacterales bacterium]|nr:DEAD/DEAH box helicase [Bryobacterales bacterium]
MTERIVSPDSGFRQFKLDDRIQEGIDALGFVDPRPIQAQTIPAGLEGRDVLGLAQTGTGKTAAFAVPILQRLLEKKRPGPRALIVAPTRELAMQIDEEIKALAKHTKIKTQTVFGGVSEKTQITGLKKNPDIIVACPGRLLDLHGQGFVDLDRVEVCVLDEADHMFDMGFLPDVRRILEAVPAKRQNLLFSATMPAEIRRFADAILQDPHVVELASSAPAETIEHVLYRVSQTQKTDLLFHLLDKEDFGSAIVFCRTKHRAKRLADQLTRGGHNAIALQGNMTQPQRDKAMSGFRSGKYDVLVATDIAARGIDVAQVSHVINFDVPSTPDFYTHRIGRTGRAERQGAAYTFVSAEDYALIHQIERRIKKKIPRLDPPVFESKPAAAAPAPAEKPARGRKKPAAEAQPAVEAAPAAKPKSRRKKPAAQPEAQKSEAVKAEAGEAPKRRRRRRPRSGGSGAPRGEQSAAQSSQSAGDRRRSRSGRRRIRRSEPADA